MITQELCWAFHDGKQGIRTLNRHETPGMPPSPLDPTSRWAFHDDWSAAGTPFRHGMPDRPTCPFTEPSYGHSMTIGIPMAADIVMECPIDQHRLSRIPIAGAP